MQGCKTRAVVVAPDVRQSWFPLLAAATVRSVPVAAKGGTGTFFRMHHQKGRVSFVFRHWGMRAVEVEHCRGEPGSTLLSGGYAPDSAKAEGSSIVDEPGEG